MSTSVKNTSSSKYVGRHRTPRRRWFGRSRVTLALAAALSGALLASPAVASPHGDAAHAHDPGRPAAGDAPVPAAVLNAVTGRAGKAAASRAAARPGTMPNGTGALRVAFPTAEVPVVGPLESDETTQSTPALDLVGYEPAPEVEEPDPVVIVDVVVEQQRAEAKKAEQKRAAAKRAAARKAAAQKAAAKQRALAKAAAAGQYVPAGTLRAANAAPAATSGGRSGYNWATKGQCTWGALDMWARSEGYYPGGWYGNAGVWGGGAAAAGYTVSSVPRARSIVVLQPGVYGSSPVGHVAWVTAVNGNQVSIVEMNALAGPFRYNTRTLTHAGGMAYIYAP